MDKILIFWDRDADTLNVWFDDPQKEHICEETDDDVVLVRDKSGRLIGFERFNCEFSQRLKDQAYLPVEVRAA